MRMWTVDPGKMCGKHLRGEYVECLMIAGTMRLEHRLDGYFAHNCIEPKSVVPRFAALKKEMLLRGYNAKKSLRAVNFAYLPSNQQNFRIDKKASASLLSTRCAACRAKMGYKKQ